MLGQGCVYQALHAAKVLHTAQALHELLPPCR